MYYPNAIDQACIGCEEQMEDCLCQFDDENYKELGWHDEYNDEILITEDDPDGDFIVKTLEDLEDESEHQ